MKISEKEYNQVIKELAERVKDCVYINLENKLKKQTSKRFLEDSNKSDMFEITYQFVTLIGDIKQILGRIRREKYGKRKPN